jgi:hypothetical protein
MNTTITPEERKNWREFAESATVCTLFPEEVWRESKKVLGLLDALEGAEAERDVLAMALALSRNKFLELSVMDSRDKWLEYAAQEAVKRKEAENGFLAVVHPLRGQRAPRRHYRQSGGATMKGGISFCGMLGILFIGLKLTGYIDWSWLWVLSPLWGSLAFGVAVIILVLALRASIKARS